MNSNLYALIQVVVMCVITFLIRVLPFIIFGRNKKTPEFIIYLGKVLPMAVMGMLVIYCLKSVSFSVISGWVPAFVSVAFVVVMHIWKRNNLISILGGTVLYMALISFLC